jgi:hypothetical protein
MEILLFVATILALFGAYLNSKGDWRGFAIWMCTNLIFLFNNYIVGQWQQAFLFLCYFLIAVNGLFNSKLKTNFLD